MAALTTEPTLRRVESDALQAACPDPVNPAARDAAKAILDDVKANGEPALLANAVRLGDIVAGDAHIKTKEECEAAYNALPADQQGVLDRTAARIRTFAEVSSPDRHTTRHTRRDATPREASATLPTSGVRRLTTTTTAAATTTYTPRRAAPLPRRPQAQLASVTSTEIDIPGGRAGHTIAPVNAAGCYAPGGRYPLPSSVLMTAVTAVTAGCKEVWVASPRPTEVRSRALGGWVSGRPHPIPMLTDAPPPLTRRSPWLPPTSRVRTACWRWVALRPSQPSPTASAGCPRAT